MARHGENIYKRKDERWEGRYVKGHKSDRKPIYGYVYAKEYSECRELLLRIKSQYPHVQNHLSICGVGLVSDFMSYWLHHIVQPQVKATTFRNYEAILKKWICPYLGNKKLSKIGREDIQRFIGTLPEQGLSAGTVRNATVSCMQL